MTECSSQLIRGNFYNEAQYNLMRSIPQADGSGGDSHSRADHEQPDGWDGARPFPPATGAANMC